MGRRINRFRFDPALGAGQKRGRGDAARASGPGSRTRSCATRSPVFVVAAGAMLALALPATQLTLTGGDNRGMPLTTEAATGPEAARGHARARRARAEPDRGRHGPRRAAPATRQVGGRAAAAHRRGCGAIPRSSPARSGAGARARRPARRASRPPRARAAQQASLVDPTRQRGPDPRRRQERHRHARRRRTSSTASATTTSRRRSFRPTPRCCSPARPRSASTSIDKAYSAFPWLVLAVLVLSYLLLLRAFRSVDPAAQGRAAQPALGGRHLRRARADVPARPGHGPARPPELGPDRGVDPDLPVRDAVRPLDGLRGLPALAHARGVGRDATTTSTPSPTASSTPAGSSPRPRSS